MEKKYVWFLERYNPKTGNQIRLLAVGTYAEILDARDELIGQIERRGNDVQLHDRKRRIIEVIDNKHEVAHWRIDAVALLGPQQLAVYAAPHLRGAL